MKKLFSFILILFILTTNLVVPISALATNENYTLSIEPSVVGDKNVTFRYNLSKKNTTTTIADNENFYLYLSIKDDKGKIVGEQPKISIFKTELNKFKTYDFTGLTPEKNYTFEAYAKNSIGTTQFNIIEKEIARWQGSANFTTIATPATTQGTAIKETDFCNVVSAVWDPSGEQKDGFYKNDGTDVANIIVKTKNCIGAPGTNLSVWGIKGCNPTGGAITDYNCPLPSIQNKPININSDNFSFKIALGEEKCIKKIGLDCDLAIQINQGEHEIYYSQGKPAGELLYDCTGYTCLGKDAQYVSMTSQGSDDQSVGITGKNDVVNNKSIYKMLAPIGNITCMDSTGQDSNCIKNDVGKYLNVIFKLLIGICAALAVIMLIINGIQYMGDESIFAKTEAKSKMFSAIFGLLIALGAWALLNTINPDLTGKNGLFISTVDVGIDAESAPWMQYQNSNGATVPGCDLGFTDVSSEGGPIHVCKSIAANLEKMIAAAKKDNPSLVLSGGGFRNRATQLKLRGENCQPPTRTPAELESGQIKCNTATAIPGTSNHEKGLAVDFSCNGKGMEQKDQTNVCYLWLVKNAKTYNFFNNFAEIGEVWHWSTDGK